MNTANKLTLLRVLLIPVFLVILYLYYPASNYLALGIFILASVTDFVDGYIARHYNQTTDFGKFMDPLADKLLVLAAMMWFIDLGQIPTMVVFVVLVREFAVSGMRMVASDRGKVIAAGWSGKVKTASTMVCLCLMFIPPICFLDVGPWKLNDILVAVILITTVYSGVEYFMKNRDVFSGAM